jgi:hypothetical protein
LPLLMTTLPLCAAEEPLEIETIPEGAPEALLLVRRNAEEAPVREIDPLSPVVAEIEPPVEPLPERREMSPVPPPVSVAPVSVPEFELEPTEREMDPVSVPALPVEREMDPDLLAEPVTKFTSPLDRVEATDPMSTDPLAPAALLPERISKDPPWSLREDPPVSEALLLRVMELPALSVEDELPAFASNAPPASDEPSPAAIFTSPPDCPRPPDRDRVPPTEEGEGPIESPALSETAAPDSIELPADTVTLPAVP